MTDFGKHTNQFVIDDFPGFYSGPSMTKLPPGAIVDSGLTSSATDIRVDDSGEIIVFSDEHRLVQFTDSVSPHASVDSTDYSNAIYWWNRNYGGDVILLSFAGQFGELVFRADGSSRPTLIPVYQLPNVWKMHSNGPHQLGIFEPFGDDLYYVDGLNPMIRFSADVYGRLEASWAGVFDRYEDINSLWHTQWKPYRGMGARFSNPGITRYCITFSSKHGESKAGYNAVRNSFQINDPTNWGKMVWGPAGSTRSIIVDWGRVLAVNPYITHANVYRTAIGSNVFQWVTKIPRYVGSIVDAKEDALLGYPMETDNEIPSNFRIICSHANRMFAVGGYESYNRISCSKLGKPEIWPPQYELPVVDSFRSDNVTLLKVIGPHLYVFMENHILRLIGSSPEDYSFEVISNSIGCIAPRTYMSWNDGAVFLSKDGLYHFNGSTLSKLSSPIYALFNNQDFGLNHIKYSCGALFGNTYLLSVVDSSIGTVVTGTYPTRVYSCNLVNGKWGVKGDGAFFLSTQMGGDKSIIYTHDTYGQGIRIVSDWYLEDHQKKSTVFNLGNMDLGYPDQVKVIEKIELVYESLAEVATYVTIYAEDDPSTTGSTNEQSYLASSGSSSFLRWGSNWDSDDGSLGFMQIHRAVHYFGKDITGFSNPLLTKMPTSKSFLISLSLGSASPEIRLQKVLIDFHLDTSIWRGDTVA
jgi:hypothetical protein